MKRSIAILSLISAMAGAVPASAAVYIPGQPQFLISTPVGTTIFNSPTISGTIALTTTTPGTFTDDFRFTLPQSGVGSGTIITSATKKTSTNFIDILSVKFDGIVVTGSYNSPTQLLQFAGLTDVPITANVQNDLVITYKTNGTGTYGGQLTFDVDAVPEPATWLTFLLGFGFLGLAFRRSRAGQLQTARAAA